MHLIGEAPEGKVRDMLWQLCLSVCASTHHNNVSVLCQNIIRQCSRDLNFVQFWEFDEFWKTALNPWKTFVQTWSNIVWS